MAKLILRDVDEVVIEDAEKQAPKRWWERRPRTYNVSVRIGKVTYVARDMWRL